jgi:mannose/fructose-specific phosphotransferase system component IIA
MGWFKTIAGLLLPYLVDLIKYVYSQLTLKKLRERRREEARKRAEAYANSQTDEEVEGTFENRP